MFICLVINSFLIYSQIDELVLIFNGEVDIFSSMYAPSKIIISLAVFPVCYFILGHKHGLMSALNYLINKKMEVLFSFIIKKYLEKNPNIVAQNKITGDFSLSNVNEYLEGQSFVLKYVISKLIDKLGFIKKFNEAKISINQRVENGVSIEQAIICEYMGYALNDYFSPSFKLPAILVFFNIAIQLT